MPFFEQMLTAVEHHVKMQVSAKASYRCAQCCKEQDCLGNSTNVVQKQQQLEQEGPRAGSMQQHTSNKDRPVLLGSARNSGLHPARGGKQGSTMVCHHWKSKGWCRLGADCKFVHPQEKRGVNQAQKSSKESMGKTTSSQLQNDDLACMRRSLAVSPPSTRFVATFSPGGYVSAVAVPSVPHPLSPMPSSETYFLLTPGFG
jgi:hypothetical protein